MDLLLAHPCCRRAKPAARRKATTAIRHTHGHSMCQRHMPAVQSTGCMHRPLSRPMNPQDPSAEPKTVAGRGGWGCGRGGVGGGRARGAAAQPQRLVLGQLGMLLN